jgi:hypothetical protein
MEDASLPSRQARTERQRVDRVLADIVTRLDELEARLGRLEEPVERDRHLRQHELDQQLIGDVRSLAQIDRAVRGYRRRLATGDFGQSFAELLPEDLRRLVEAETAA